MMASSWLPSVFGSVFPTRVGRERTRGASMSFVSSRARPWMFAAAVLTLGACAASDGDPASDTTGGGDVTDSSTGSDTTDPAQTPAYLHGTVPSEALPAPKFVATNLDGSSRGTDNLIGTPTVMWFYPVAATSG